MRAQLDQLRALTQFYQTGDNGSVPVDDDGLMGENSSHEDSAEENERDVDEEEAFISSLRPMRCMVPYFMIHICYAAYNIVVSSFTANSLVSTRGRKLTKCQQFPLAKYSVLPG